MNDSTLIAAASPILYADLVPNTVMGEHCDVYDAAMSDRWRSIFSGQPSGAAEQASIALVLAMRALLSVVAPRPPGNVHARQQMTVHALPTHGQMVRSEVRCLQKEIKRNRRYIDFAVKGLAEQGQVLYEAQMSLIWAA